MQLNKIRKKRLQFITASRFTVFIDKAKASILLLSLCDHELLRLCVPVKQHAMISGGSDEWPVVLMLHSIQQCRNKVPFSNMLSFI